MTPEQLREAAAVMLAAADGKKIQYSGGDKIWRDIVSPLKGAWDFESFDYRIKPEPRKITIALYECEGYMRSYTHMECVPPGWVRVSDYVNLEVRD